MLYPYSVPDFLTKKERLDIKDRIFSLKDRWITLNGECGLANDPTKKSFTLGHAGYVLVDHKNLFESRADSITMLRDYFDDVYDKTLFFLKKELEVEILPFYEFTLPGFHIFRGPRKAAFGNLDLHRDRDIFQHYPQSPDYEKTTYAFSSLIHSTTRAHLEYKRQDEEHVRSLEYKEGDLNIWHSYVYHKIGTCDIEENQHRITYQGLVFKYKGKHYMYF